MFIFPEKELRKKWDSLRTQYSRYTKMIYTDGRFFTPRQQWIMQRLKFLDPHIKRRSNYCTDLDYEVTRREKSHTVILRVALHAVSHDIEPHRDESMNMKTIYKVRGTMRVGGKKLHFQQNGYKSTEA